MKIRHLKSKDFFLDFFVLLIFLGAFFFRFYKFDTVPYGLNHDGAQDGLQAIDLILQPLPYRPYVVGGSGETLFKYYLSFLIRAFGANVRTIKFGSTLLSFLTVPVFYFFVKELAGKKIAVFSTFLLSISGWQIIMGKTVWRAISTPLIESALLLFLVKAIKKKKGFYFALSGLFLSLALNTYNGARSLLFFTPLALLVVFVFFLQKKVQFREVFRYFIFFSAAFAITVYPLFNYARKNWAEFNSRFNSLSVFSQIQERKSFLPIKENLIKTALIFNVRANGDDFFVSQPLLDAPVSWFFLCGILVCLLNFKKPIFLFAFVGLITNLLPGLLSVPNGNRNIAVMPFVYLISGFGLNTFWFYLTRIFQKKKILPLVIAFSICLFGIVNTCSTYIGKNRRELWGFYPETTIVGNFMKPLISEYDFYLTDNYPRDALTFLTYKDGDPFIQHYHWLETKEEFLEVERKKKTLFIMFASEENHVFLNKLREKYPLGEKFILDYKDDNINRPAALIYKVD